MIVEHENFKSGDVQLHDYIHLAKPILANTEGAIAIEKKVSKTLQEGNLTMAGVGEAYLHTSCLLQM